MQWRQYKKVIAELKSFGWPSDIGDPKCKCKNVSSTKTELNCSGTKIVVELKIAAELKFGEGPFGDGDPKSKCKKVSRTKTELQLKQN